jgi:4-hydroxythreonine-4-phosphate dehydrogenase
MPPRRIGVTLGDPAGIGPEIVLRWLNHAPQQTITPVFFGNAVLLRRVAESLRIPWPARLAVLPAGDTLPATHGPVLLDFPFPEAAALEPGRVQAACGRIAATWIEAATREALAGRIDALVTAPIHKEAIHLAGVPFPGHTEMLASLTGAAHTTMLFWSPELLVSLATIHIPFHQVPARLNTAGLLETLRQTATACARFGRADRPIAVLALNPHGGEHGLFGDEEARLLEPALAAARAEGIATIGPLVPDTAFLPERRATVAAYVALYHDQGLIPFKMLAFAEGVNVTLGLPIVRTSPDHGTAFDIAWQGRADCSSLAAAIQCATLLACGRG